MSEDEEHDYGRNDDDENHRQQYRSSDDEHDVRHHKKKKKHKHKHKHRHRAHEDHGDEPDRSNEAVSGTPKITLRLGKEKKEDSSWSVTTPHGSHPHHPTHQPEPWEQHKVTSGGKSHSRSRSMSQTPISPVVTKQEEVIQEFTTPHVQHGQKRPFSSLKSERSMSEETELAEPATEPIEDYDFDDPLAGDLDDPDDDMGDDGDDEEEGLEQQGSDNTDDDDDLMSPTMDPGSRAQLGSKTVKGGQRGSKTIPGAKSSKVKKPKAPKEDASREGSEQATTKSGRKGKGHQKRASVPRITTPAVPKKKELSVVCNKLLDSFIKKDMYVLFTEPVDPVLVPDYSSVIKNPMDLSTMRAKVERNFYPNIDEFLNDFKLICDNARIYNSKETLYWKQADKLWEWGSKAIERERKSVLDKDEELLRSIRDDETVDVGGMGDYNNNITTMGRGSLLSIDGNVDSPASMADSGRSHTPQQYRKTKKIKHRRDGTIAFTYSTDGSIDPASHPDPWSLVPVAQDFGSAPLVCPLVESNLNYNGQYLDDYPYWKAPTCVFRPAVFQDYGPYAILGRPTPDTGGASGVQNIPAYTGMVFGDEKGEAYVRSLAMFLDGIVDEKELADMSNEDAAGLLEVREHVRNKIEMLTRGASTIVDKVASVIREEKTGNPTEVDTRVPLKLWRQDFTAEDGESTRSIKMEVTDDTKYDLLKDIKQESDDVEMTEADYQMQEDREATEELPKGDERMDSGAGTESENARDDPQQRLSGKDEAAGEKQEEEEGKEDTSKWVDIRQVLRDIRAWPKILREKLDHESWKQLKVELDTILPPSQRTSATAATTSAASQTDDEIEIKWGQKWTGSDYEESKMWVHEQLEQNSAEMRQVIHLMAAKSISESPAASATASVAASPTTSASATGSPAAVSTPTTTVPPNTAGSDMQDSAQQEQLIRSIRKRLAEMAQYIPLSEVNPQRLPPPVVPLTPRTATAASTPKATTSTTAAVASSDVPVPDSPDGSLSSLSSPGSSSP